MSYRTRKLIFSRFITGESINYLATKYNTTVSDVEDIIRSHVAAINKEIQSERDELYKRGR